MIEVIHITTPEQQQAANHIREVVFVKEQQVPAEEEYDEYEAISRHFLAYADHVPCGTARWRYTDKGVKLERFAVLKAYRSRKVGSALVDAVLKDVQQHSGFREQKIYLHAQVTAMPLYAKFGFKAEGALFSECDIDHYKMVLQP